MIVLVGLMGITLYACGISANEGSCKFIEPEDTVAEQVIEEQDVFEYDLVNNTITINGTEYDIATNEMDYIGGYMFYYMGNGDMENIMLAVNSQDLSKKYWRENFTEELLKKATESTELEEFVQKDGEILNFYILNSQDFLHSYYENQMPIVVEYSIDEVQYNTILIFCMSAYTEDEEVVYRTTDILQRENLDEWESVPVTQDVETELDVTVLDALIGEYEYPSDFGSGKLIIEKTEFGYDISDYESEDSYRFLANSSNIESAENNRICIKYPAQVFSDDTVIFNYYTLVYDTEKIDVYYQENKEDEEEFLYRAVKGNAEKENEKKENAERTSEELLDLFIDGSIDAVDFADSTVTVNIADFNMDSEEWDSCSIGERIDLDNDGEEELIICGPYGGMYLDGRDDKVYIFAAGDGTANTLSYTYYNGEIWILYSNNMNEGYDVYHMKKYEGADNLVAEMSFGEEPVDANNPETGMKYSLNDKEVSYDEYAAFCSKIFAAEVSTYVSR